MKKLILPLLIFIASSTFPALANTPVHHTNTSQHTVNNGPNLEETAAWLTDYLNANATGQNEDMSFRNDSGILVAGFFQEMSLYNIAISNNYLMISYHQHGWIKSFNGESDEDSINKDEISRFQINKLKINETTSPQDLKFKIPGSDQEKQWFPYKIISISSAGAPAVELDIRQDEAAAKVMKVLNHIKDLGAQ